MKKLALPTILIVAGSIIAFVISNQQIGKVTEPVPMQLGKIPEDAAIIFLSTRYVKNPSIIGTFNLYTMNEDGGNVTQITFKPEEYEHAAISFDRRFIAADRYINSKFGGEQRTTLWVIDLAENSEHQLVPDFYSAGPGGVDWSPDGFIYFAGQPKKGAQNIYKIKPDGSELTQITFLTQNLKSDPPEPAAYNDISVSEDGSMIAAVRVIAKKADGQITPKTQIWVVNADGSQQRMIDDGGPELGVDPIGFPIGDYDPEISPDNQSVVFSRVNTKHKNFPKFLNTAHDLWIAPLDGSAPSKRLTEEGPVSIIPDWHEGKILYTEYNERENYIGLVMINPDGTGKRRLEGGLNSLFDGGRHGKFLP